MSCAPFVEAGLSVPTGLYKMDANSNTSEMDDAGLEPKGTGGTAPVSPSASENTPPARAVEKKTRFCDDKEYKHKLNDLKVKEKKTSTRLEVVERRLTLTENKLRSCDDMLVLIGLLRDRLEQVYPEVGPLLGDADASSSSQSVTVPRSN